MSLEVETATGTPGTESPGWRLEAEEWRQDVCVPSLTPKGDGSHSGKRHPNLQWNVTSPCPLYKTNPRFVQTVPERGKAPEDRGRTAGNGSTAEVDDQLVEDREGMTDEYDVEDESRENGFTEYNEEQWKLGWDGKRTGTKISGTELVDAEDEREVEMMETMQDTRTDDHEEEQETVPKRRELSLITRVRSFFQKSGMNPSSASNGSLTSMLVRAFPRVSSVLAGNGRWPAPPAGASGSPDRPKPRNRLSNDGELSDWLGFRQSFRADGDDDEVPGCSWWGPAEYAAQYGGSRTADPSLGPLSHVGKGKGNGKGKGKKRRPFLDF